MEITVGDSKTECVNPKTVDKSEASNKGGSVKKGGRSYTKKRKNRKEVVISSSDDLKKSKKIRDSVDDDATCSSRSLGLVQKIRGGSGFDAIGVLIPRRPRGLVGRSRFSKSHLHKQESATVENVAGCKSNQKKESATVASARNAKRNGGDSVKPIGSSGSKDQVAKLKGKIKETPYKTKGKGIDLVLNIKDSSSERSDGNSRKRKMPEPSSETVAKKVESSVEKKADLDPDDDLEQNAARMLSSRFNPTCTDFASKNTTLALSSGIVCNVGSQGPMSASTNAADGLLYPRRRQEGEGTSKRRQYFDVRSYRMSPLRYLNRKIKIYWPLDKCWYYGVVKDYDLPTNQHYLKYDDDSDEEWICLDDERFELLLRPSELPRKPVIQNTASSEISHQRSTSGVCVQDETFMSTHRGSEPISRAEDTDNVIISVNVNDETFMASCMESEPLISGLSHRGKSSSSTSLKKQNTFLNTSIYDRWKSEEKTSNDSEGHAPIVYLRRRNHRFSDTVAVTECEKFEVRTSFWPMPINAVLGADMLWLFRRVFLLQYGTVATMWPTVFLEVLFVDNIAGLKFFRFEGCLKQAVAFVLLVMKVFCEPEEVFSNQIPETSIRFKLSFSQNFSKHKVFSYCRFSKVRDFNWQHLDSEFQLHCLVSKQLSLSECTHENVKLLEAGKQHSLIPCAAKTASYKVLRKSRTVYSLKHGRISPFAPSTPGVPQHLLMSDLTWNSSDGIICSSNHPTIPRILWHLHNSSMYGDLWADGKEDFFGNGPKKPRTQVQYTLPKNKDHNQIGLPYQRIRKSKDQKTPSVTAATSKGIPQKNFEPVACEANILIYVGDKGWRECGARVFLEADQQNEWRLAVKCSGELRYAHKVQQDFQPGSTNRHTHAMIWKGGKDWALEFPDRSQWVAFKEMHEECHNRNIRATSVKKIPIPGVRLIKDSVDEDMPCFNRGFWYMRQVGEDVEMAMDASHVMYDMDSEDEEWVLRSTRGVTSEEDMISDELFEKVMDMLEKVSYSQKRDHFTSEEIDELIARVSPMQVTKSIYNYWQEKRQRKGMPLLRQFQPPLWEIYQQRCREWMKRKSELATDRHTESREDGSTTGDKPPMFAFCLKPRGLELLNKGSKHRPHKKISMSAFVGVPSSHHSSGKRNKGKKRSTTSTSTLVLGGSDLEEFRARELVNAATHARNVAKLKRERARKLMMNADLAIQKAVSALMTAEAMKPSCTGTGTGDDGPSATS